MVYISGCSLAKWVDGSPLTFTKWSDVNYSRMPLALYDCDIDRCIKQTVEHVLHEALSMPQPHLTANRSRPCAALVFGGHFQWVMIPCKTPMKSTMQICETRNIQTRDSDMDCMRTNANFTYDDAMRNVKDLYIYLDYDVNIYVFEHTRGSVSLYSDFTPMINCFAYDHSYISHIDNLPFCPSGWLLSLGLCFQLIITEPQHTYASRTLFSTCITSSILIKANITHITQNNIIDYLDKWVINDNKSIYLFDELGEDVNNYKCRNFKISDAHNDFYALDPRRLNESMDAAQICSWKDIDYLLCLRQPENVPNKCPEGTHQCMDGSCISESYRCDSQHDCPAGDDERNCMGAWSSSGNQTTCVDKSPTGHSPCGDLQFQCAPVGCIDIALVSLPARYINKSIVHQ